MNGNCNIFKLPETRFEHIVQNTSLNNRNKTDEFISLPSKDQPSLPFFVIVNGIQYFINHSRISDIYRHL